MTTPATTWNKTCLAEVADLCLGKMLDQNKNRGEYLPYLANVNVRWGTFDLSGLREMRFESHETSRYGLKYGDIVMCEGGEPGRCAIWKDEQPGMMIQKALHRIRARDGVDNRFLYYSFLNKGRTGGFAPLFTGSTIKHLPGQNLAKIEVDLPSLPTQQRIAALLSAYDDLIENNRRRIRLLEQFARLLYKEWFVRFCFPGHESATAINGVPERWEKRRLEELADVTMGQSPPSSQYNEVGAGLPFHQGVGDFGDQFVTHRVFTTAKNRVSEPGDILCSVRAPVGRLNVTTDRMVIGRGLAAIRSKFDHQSFLLRQLHVHFFKEDMIGTGAIFASVGKKELLAQRMLTPDDRLISLFEEQARPIDIQLRTLFIENGKLGLARNLLLPRLMNGEIAV